jgi:hypothetical protein
MTWLAEAGVDAAAASGEFGQRPWPARGSIWTTSPATARSSTSACAICRVVGGARGHMSTLLGRLARAARRDLRLGAHEALVLIELLVAIPEEAGRLVFEERSTSKAPTSFARDCWPAASTPCGRADRAKPPRRCPWRLERRPRC